MSSTTLNLRQHIDNCLRDLGIRFKSNMQTLMTLKFKLFSKTENYTSLSIIPKIQGDEPCRLCKIFNELAMQALDREGLEPMKLTQQQLETHLWSAANILRGKTAGQDYKNYILSLMFCKRLCDQSEHEVDEAIVEQEQMHQRTFTDKEKAIFRIRNNHRYRIHEGCRWGDVLAESMNIGKRLTTCANSATTPPLPAISVKK